jgi:hypothetical protein
MKKTVRFSDKLVSVRTFETDENANVQHLFTVLKKAFDKPLEKIVSDALTNLRENKNEGVLFLEEENFEKIQRRIERYFRQYCEGIRWRTFFLLLEENKLEPLGKFLGLLLKEQVLADDIEVVNPHAVLLLKMSDSTSFFNCNNRCDPTRLGNKKCDELYDLIKSLLDEESRKSQYLAVDFLSCFDVQFQKAFGCTLIGPLSVPRGGAEKYRYVVEPIDVDGDGVPDGDLVKQYQGKKLITQKFVPNKQLKKIVKAAEKKEKEAVKKGIQSPKKKIIYSRNTKKAEENPVIVKDKTNFGQYLKMGVGLGAGMEVGKMAVRAIADGISELF